MVRFHTCEFEFSQGRSPRGRGSWAFFFSDEERRIEDVWFTPGSTTYTDAKKLAAQEAKRRGVRDVYAGA